MVAGISWQIEGTDSDDFAQKEGTYQSQKRPLRPGRFHLGIVGDFISERRAISNRNGGRFHFGMVVDFARNPAIEGV